VFCAYCVSFRWFICDKLQIRKEKKQEEQGKETADLSVDMFIVDNNHTAYVTSQVQ